MMLLRYNMLRNSNGKHILPYKQTTELVVNVHNCKLKRKVEDIDSLFFHFENCNNVVSGQIEKYDGNYFSQYTEIKRVYITDNMNMDMVWLDDIYHLHYSNEYVMNNYKHWLKKSFKSCKEFVGYYFVDWSESEQTIKMIYDTKCKIIELNYFVVNE